MVKTTSAILPINDGQIDIEAWLTQLAVRYTPKGIASIRHACEIAQLIANNAIDKNYLRQALEIANRLANMEADFETIAAAIAYHAVQTSELDQDDIKENLGARIAKLVHGVMQMDAIQIFQNQTNNQQQIDNVREMLLTMVDDVRVVLIKLAERCYLMQAMEFQGEKKQIQMAEETRLIYAPLASRLGISEIKWELEDLAFRYLETDKYKNLAKQVNEKRLVREAYVADFIETLMALLNEQKIQHEISGRAKHIYSIYKKMQRKGVDYSEIYDATAVRILVNNIEDCYKALSIVHTQWQHIPEEFDDYVAIPKPNGYQSIHTVSIGPNQKHVEIQIRTFKMHEENELGVAAHWLYKEGTGQSAYDRKIAWLRELLAWEQELADASELPEHLKENLVADRVFVFTPNGDLISLPLGATPLDFAYHIHSEIGHRCKGAKVNGKMIQLTQALQTGDRVEILTHKTAQPSRDWLNPHSGYLISSRARAKVHSWFRKQEQERYNAEGRAIIDKELKKLGIKSLDMNKIARRLHLKTADNLAAVLGSQELAIADFIAAIEQETTQQKPDETFTIRTTKIDTKKLSGFSVEGVDDLVTHIAGCCKPLPGDKIVGYVTQEHGITIHKAECDNILRQAENNQQRIFDVSWGEKSHAHFPVDLQIEALDRSDLLHDVTMVLSQAKINLLDLSTKTDQKNHLCKIHAQLAIRDIENLNQTINQLKQLTNIYDVKRI